VVLDKPQTQWAENWKYANRRIGAILSAPARQSPSHCGIGATDPDAWEKSIRLKWPDGEEERITIGEVLEMQASHVVGHIDDIQLIRQTHMTEK